MQTRKPDMLPVILPETLNFMRQVELNRTIEGIYPISKLSRLKETLLSDEGFVTAKLDFGQSAGFASLKGSLSAKLTVECQRCLRSVETEVTGGFKFALVASKEKFELLPDELEPYLLKGEDQSVIELIEDELLLSLPMVIVHEYDCSDYMKKQNSKVQAAIKADKEASNPFAVLQALKGNKTN